MAVPEPLAAWVEVLQEAVPELWAAVGVEVALVALLRHLRHLAIGFLAAQHDVHRRRSNVSIDAAPGAWRICGICECASSIMCIDAAPGARRICGICDRDSSVLCIDAAHDYKAGATMLGQQG